MANPIRLYDWFPLVGAADLFLRRDESDDYFGTKKYKPDSIVPFCWAMWQACSTGAVGAYVIYRTVRAIF